MRKTYTVPPGSPDLLVTCYPGFICRPRVDADMRYHDFVDAAGQTRVSIGLRRLQPTPSSSSAIEGRETETCVLPGGSPNLIFSASAGGSVP